MSYPGNPSLEPEIQERISTTFQQTLELASQKKDQEARLGCEFILRMDPQYQPAQKLLARLKSGGGGPAAVAAPPAGAGDDFDAALDDLDDLAGIEDPGFAAPAAAKSGLATVVEDLIARRNFQQVLQIAASQREAVARDPALQRLVETARSRAESEPFVATFLENARRARAEGRDADALREVEKARALDADHPGIAELAGGAAAAVEEPVLGFEEDEPLDFGAPPEPAKPPASPSADDLADLQALQQASLSLAGEDDLEEDSFAALGLGDDELTDDAEPSTADDDLGADDLAADDLADELSFGDLDEPDASAVAPPADLQASAAAVEEEPPPAADDDLLAFDDDEPADLAAPSPEAPAPGRGKIGAADDSGDRVQQLLDEGQEAFDRDEYQSAIDVWSRIFLIEIDNAEASRRIESARNRKAELERQAEEVFHQAAEQIEAKDLEGAQETLRRVLELSPTHGMARDYLEQLAAGQVPAVRRRDVVADAEGEAAEGASLDVVEVPSAQKSMEAAVARDRMVAVKKTNKMLLAGGAALAALLVVGAVFLMTKWDDLFPNAEAPPPAERVDPIERATQMHQAGNTENAILLLSRVPPNDPLYEDAQALAAQWQALVTAPGPTLPTGPDETQVSRRRLMVEAAQRSQLEGYHRRAVELLERAGRITPLSAEEASIQRRSQEALADLAEPVGFFEAGEYGQAIPILWRLREQDPTDRDVQELLVSSYFNMALRELQRGNAADAADLLEEGDDVAPGDEDLERLKLFAAAYESRSQDLLYRIFVKYQPPRR